MELRQQQRSAPVRPAHPVMRELVAGVDLSTAALAKRTDASQHSTFAQMLSNAEYWLSFDVAAFEPLLMKSPSPLRELGVAIALRFSEGVDGGLTLADINRARELLDPNLAEDLKKGVSAGLDALERVITARESVPALEEAGFKRYTSTKSLSVHALRAMGKSNIAISGHADDEKRVEVRIGEQVLLTSTDEKGRPLQAPEIESHLEAPLYAREETETNKRTIFLLVPGEYFVRVPGRATGDRKLVAI